MINLNPKEAQFEKGWANRFNRFYLYIQRGLAILNEFHSVILLFATIIIGLKISSYSLIASGVLATLPILAAIGWYSVHRLGKFTEYFGIKHGSHYQLANFEIIKETRDLLKDIKKILETNQQ